MMLKTKHFSKACFSFFFIIIMLAVGIIFGSKGLIYADIIAGDNIQAPVMNSNSILLEIPNTSPALSNNNYAFWFYYNALVFSSISGKFGDQPYPAVSNLKKNVFTASWETGDFRVYNNLKVDGIVTTTGYTCSSDIRFKHNIAPVSGALQKIMTLQGVTYDWNIEKFKDRSFSKERQIGLIAQDVEKVLPELVSTDEEGYKSIHYDKLTAVLVEAVKEMSAKTTALEKENASLKQRLASLEKMNDRIARLESQMKQQKAVLASR